MSEGMILKIVRVAMEVISMRLLTILSMAMSFALAVWTMLEPSWERMAMAAFFAVYMNNGSFTDLYFHHFSFLFRY